MEKKINILHIDNTCTFGGAINALHVLVQNLDKKKFKSIIVTGHSLNYMSLFFSRCVTYHFLPKRSWIDSYVFNKFKKKCIFKVSIFRKLLIYARSVFWLFFINFPESIHYYKIGKKHDVDIVHLNNNLSSQLSGILASKLLGVPCIVHVRNFDDISFVTKLYAKMVNQIIAISKSVHDHVVKLEISENSINLIHDAVNDSFLNRKIFNEYLYSEFSLNQKNYIFGICARVIPWKGIKEFIYSAKFVVDKFHDAKIFIVGDISDGDESYYNECVALASFLKIENNLFFTGYRTDVAELMSIFDIVVHASIEPEPFGLVIVEGMALKKPVVATKAGGALDIVLDNETGILVDIGDIEGMANAILRLLEDDDLRRKMGMAGYSRVCSHFSSKIHASKMESVFLNLLVKKRI